MALNIPDHQKSSSNEPINYNKIIDTETSPNSYSCDWAYDGYGWKEYPKDVCSLIDSAISTGQQILKVGRSTIDTINMTETRANKIHKNSSGSYSVRNLMGWDTFCEETCAEIDAAIRSGQQFLEVTNISSIKIIVDTLNMTELNVRNIRKNPTRRQRDIDS